MRLYALSAGVEAPTTDFSGVIHSVFRHACNVSLTRNALCTLVASEKRNCPQGIRLGTPPEFTFLNHLHRHQPVSCRGGIVRISGADLSVDLRTARSWHIDLKKLRINLHQRETAQAWAVAWRELEQHRHGNQLFPMRAARLPATQTPVTSPVIRTLVERAMQIVPALIEATRHFQMEGAIAAIRPLIGLGPGLTPSGDDFIVGYLAGLWSTAGTDPSRLRFISSVGAWLSQAAAGTNTISSTYIRSAVNGNVSEPIATLAQRVAQVNGMDSIREATWTALEVGHTSGADGVLGLLLGCLAWATPATAKPACKNRLSILHPGMTPHARPTRPVPVPGNIISRQATSWPIHISSPT